MKIKTKITFSVVITLAIGALLGAMLNRTLSQTRIKRILSRRTPPVFVSFYEDIIEPDANQRKEIEKILDKHAKQLSEIHANFRQKLESSIESLTAELDPILTPKQKKRLEKGFPGPPQFPKHFIPGITANKYLMILKEKLGLSEDQASKIKHILEEWEDKTRMMRRNRGPFNHFEQFIQSEKEKEKAIEKILTKDQMKLHEKMKKERLKKIEEEMRIPRKIIK